jgi:hypothetical protein
VALYNESLAARFNLLIRRLHVMKGQAPAPQVSPELTHSIGLADDRVEHHILAQEDECWGTASIPAVAAQFSSFYVANRAGSGTVAVVRVRVSSSTVQVFECGIGPTTDAQFLNAVTGFRGFRDARKYNGVVGNNNEQPSVDIRTLNQAVDPFSTVNIRAFARVAANTPIWLPGDVWDAVVVLSPGTFFLVQPTALNVDMVAAAVWRQRPMEPSETAPI